MKTISSDQRGFTLAEVVIAVLLLALVIGGMLTSFIIGRVSTFQSRYHTQAFNLLQAKAEELSVGAYEDVQDQDPTNVTIDPGADLTWGTEDDLVGTLEVDVADRMDMDGDGDSAETEIDLDGDGINDNCKPFHLDLTWESRSYGSSTQKTISLDSLIGKR